MHNQESRNKLPLSTKGFFDQYADLLRQLRTQGASGPGLNAEVRDAWVPFQVAIYHLKLAGFTYLLQAAQAEGHPEAFKELLELLVNSLGLETPRGVFTPKPKTGKPGRLISKESARIYSKWVEIGEPPPHKNDLAKAFYGVLFTKASGIVRRRMRDRCRNVIDRHLDRLIAGLEKRRAEQEKRLAEQEKELVELEKKLAEKGTVGPRC